MFFGPLLLVGLVIAAIWFFQQQENRPRIGQDRGSGSSQAMEVLRTRYARGEISRDEYERIRRDLE